MFGVSPRIIVSHGTQTKVDGMWSSIGKGTQMTIDGEACFLHSRPYLTMVSSEVETGRYGPRDPSMLFDAINEAGKG